MNLQSLLAARLDAGKPVRVGLVGAGKFGSMFLAQVPSIAGLEVALICDRDVDRAKAACRTVGWDAARIARTQFSAGGRDACTDERVEVVVEATGDPGAGIAHARAAIEARKPIVMVNVEADALAGPWLAAKARAAGVIYSLAYGDQPALIAEMVDWRARLVSSWLLPARAPNICRPTTRLRRMACGSITGSPHNRRAKPAWFRKCSIPFSTAPNQPSR